MTHDEIMAGIIDTHGYERLQDHRPGWPPHPSDLITDCEIAHARRLVHHPATRTAFQQRHPAYEPIPTTDEQMINRLLNDRQFCRAVQLDYTDWFVALAQGDLDPVTIINELRTQEEAPAPPVTYDT
jgi:hypothetical protein